MDDETTSYDGRSRLQATIVRLTDHLPRDLGLQRGVDTSWSTSSLTSIGEGGGVNVQTAPDHVTTHR